MILMSSRAAKTARDLTIGDRLYEQGLAPEAREREVLRFTQDDHAFGEMQISRTGAQ